MGPRVNHNRLTLHLLRHGETELSREDRFCGAIDADLTDAGRRMAQAFTACWARHLTRPAWRAIYTSERRRTIETAAPFAGAIGLSPIVDRGLDEINYGSWQGRTKEEIARAEPMAFRRWLADPTVGVPGGESAHDVARRAREVLARIQAAHAEDGGAADILIVGHKTWLRLLVCLLTGVELRLYRERIPQPVAGHSVLELDGRGWSLRRLADRSHLPPELDALSRSDAGTVRVPKPRKRTRSVEVAPVLVPVVAPQVVPSGVINVAPQPTGDFVGEQQAGGGEAQVQFVHDQPSGALAALDRDVAAVGGVATIAESVSATVNAVDGA
jgi:probable phosphoglycerate mutase